MVSPSRGKRLSHMYILQIHKYYRRGGGADHCVLETERLLREAGHETGVFSTAREDNLMPEGPFRFVPGRNLERDAHGIRSIPFAFSAIYCRRAERELDSFLRERRPDVAYLHNYHYHLTPSILRALRRHRIPTVHILHDYHLVCPNHNLYDRRIRAVCEACGNGSFLSPVRRRCRDGSLGKGMIAAAELMLYRGRRLYREAVQAYVSPSRFLIEKMREMGFDHPSMDVLPLFVDLEEFKPRPKSDPPTIVHFAGLEPHKGILTVIRAMKQVSGARLIIAGTGSQEEEAKRLAGELGLENVEFAGYQSGESLRRLIAEATTSIQAPEWYENHPLSVLESFASGTPVVAARIGGLPEMIDAGGTGEFFETGDANGLACALNGMVSRPGHAARMGANARAKAENSHSPALHLERLLGFFAKARAALPRA